jgi:polynucleotide 5'-kinase involved in rRNA processing
LTGDSAFDNWIRWRQRNLVIIAGDEGSGKSTFSQILAFKLLTGPQLLNTCATISVCA